jgi:hypothetical protein
MLATEYDKQSIPTQQVVQLPFLDIHRQVRDEDGADIVGGNDVERVGDGRGGELVTAAVVSGEGSAAMQPDDGGPWAAPTRREGWAAAFIDGRRAGYRRWLLRVGEGSGQG